MIGLLGGTFDPVHCGHLDVARAARDALGLDEVWLVPARVPPHRTAPHASASHRFAMTALAVADDQRLLVSDLEMESQGPSYTIDTHERLERSGVDASQICFVTGADAFRDIGSWKSHEELLARCRFAVVSRPGLSALALQELLPGLGFLAALVESLEHDQHLVFRPRDSSHNFRAGHPGGLRCSSLKYRQYSRALPAGRRARTVLRESRGRNTRYPTAGGRQSSDDGG